jgi:sirohydrochlorin cobaltochelatase
MPDRSAIILFAHGAREPEWALPFERLCERLRASGMRVELAYLTTMSPSLEEAARALAREGVKAATVVPLFLAQGGHLKQDLPRMIDDIRSLHPGMRFAVTPALGDAPEMLDAMTAWVMRAAGQKGEASR